MPDSLERKKLIEYLPPIMQKFSEIKEIMKAEQAQMDSLNEKIMRVLDNAFINDCDEYTIRKYEAALNIICDVSEPLEIRKSRVLMRWNNFVPYTYRTMIKKLNIMCGSNNYDIDADLENYNIDITIYYVTDELEIVKMLENILPMNTSYNVHLAEKNAGINRVGMIWQDDEIFDLRQVII